MFHLLIATLLGSAPVKVPMPVYNNPVITGSPHRTYSDSLTGRAIRFTYGYDVYTPVPGSRVSIGNNGYYNIAYRLTINTHNRSMAACSSDFFVAVFVNGRQCTQHAYWLGSAIFDALLDGTTSTQLKKGDVVELRCSTNVSFWELQCGNGENRFTVEIKN